MKQKNGWIILIACIWSHVLFAQSLPFVWGHSWGVGARAMGMGNGYTAVADDYSALFYNPAGLGQLKNSEIMGSLSSLSVENEASFNNVVSSESSNYTKLSDAGLAVAVPTYRGSLVLGFGYHQVRDFDNALYLRREVNTPGDSVSREHHRIQEGGLSIVALGGSSEMAPGLFLGASLNIWVGEEDYTWRMRERDDLYNLYTFSDTSLTEHINTRFNGVNVTLAMLYRKENFRFGGVIATPVTLTGKEEWDYRETLTMDDGTMTEVFGAEPSEYKVQMPWVIRLGGAINQGPFLISGDVSFINYSQIKYKTDLPDGTSMVDENILIKQNFQNVVQYRIGGELSIPKTNIKLRGGYGIYPSHMKDVSGFEKRVLSFGAGMNMGENVRLDVAYAKTDWEVLPYTVIWDAQVSDQSITASKFLIGFAYHLNKEKSF